MKTKLSLAIATLAISCGAFAAGPAAATTWSGRDHAKTQTKQMAKKWANERGAAPVLGREDIAAEIGANEHHAHKAMREGSMQNMQGLRISRMPS